MCDKGGGADGTSRHIRHSPGTPTTGLRERGNNTRRSTGRSGRQNAATRRNTRRDERVTVQGPVKKQQLDGTSHRGGGGGVRQGRISVLRLPKVFPTKFFEQPGPDFCVRWGNTRSRDCTEGPKIRGCRNFPCRNFPQRNSPVHQPPKATPTPPTQPVTALSALKKHPSTHLLGTVWLTTKDHCQPANQRNGSPPLSPAPPSRSVWKVCAFERVPSGSSWEVAVSNRLSLPKAPFTPSFSSP